MGNPQNFALSSQRPARRLPTGDTADFPAALLKIHNRELRCFLQGAQPGF